MLFKSCIFKSVLKILLTWYDLIAKTPQLALYPHHKTDKLLQQITQRKVLEYTHTGGKELKCLTQSPDLNTTEHRFLPDITA